MDSASESRSRSVEELSESTSIPIAPPRTKSKKKLALLKSQAAVSKSAPTSPVPGTSPVPPKRPPPPSPKPGTTHSSRAVKDLLRHPRVEKTSSTPGFFSSGPVRGVSTPDSSLSVSAKKPERPKAPNPKPTSSLSAHSLPAGSSEQLHSTGTNGHSRSSSESCNVYTPSPQEDQKSRRKSQGEPNITILNSRVGDRGGYLNVAPRLPPSNAVKRTTNQVINTDRAGLITAYSQGVSRKAPRQANGRTGLVQSYSQELSRETTDQAGGRLVKSYSQDSKLTTSPSRTLNPYQTSPPRRPQNPPTCTRNRQAHKIKPQRPALPSREKLPHIYTQIGPVEGEEEEENVYSYVHQNPRFILSASRQLDGLDLGSTGQHEHYVNDDYLGPVRKRRGSADESMYMSLTASTMSQDDVYTAPVGVVSQKPWQRMWTSNDETAEANQAGDSDQLLDTNHYTPLIRSTIDESSLYHSVTVSQS